MNEVEKHYAGPAAAEGDTGSEGLAGTVKAKLGDAAQAADGAYEKAARATRDTLRDARGRLQDSYGAVSRHASGARQRSVSEFDRARRYAGDFVEENPIMVGVVGLAAGLLIGALLPGTRRENRLFGRYADEARAQGLDYARDLAEQGRQIVQESLRPAGSPPA